LVFDLAVAIKLLINLNKKRQFVVVVFNFFINFQPTLDGNIILTNIKVHGALGAKIISIFMPIHYLHNFNIFFLISMSHPIIAKKKIKKNKMNELINKLKNTAVKK
jgi:hypothetical protein